MVNLYVLENLRRGSSGRPMGNRAQMGGTGNLVSLFIGILIAAIIAVNVFIPVVNDAIVSSNVSGTEKTILELLPLFGSLLVMIALAAPLMRRT